MYVPPGVQSGQTNFTPDCLTNYINTTRVINYKSNEPSPPLSEHKYSAQRTFALTTFSFQCCSESSVGSVLRLCKAVMDE